MNLCEKNIDCLECQARGMCNSYAIFKYNQGRIDAIDELLSKIHTTWLFRGNDAKAYREEIDYIAEQIKEKNNGKR